jgi:putative ABC transport system ATP-binding protein
MLKWHSFSYVSLNSPKGVSLVTCSTIFYYNIQELSEEKNVSPPKQDIQAEVIPLANQTQALIQLRQVYKIYETAAGDFPALRGISTDIYPGEFLGVIGKSGAGKSTLMNMITGVDHLTSGEVIIHRDHESVSIHTLTEDDLALWRGRSVGVVYQSFQLLPMLTLVENIMLPMDFCGLYNRSESRARAMELLRMVELEEHAFKLPNYISGGQQQRVAIARALANDPPILVADEPTGSLDSMTADHVFEVFERLIKDGKTIIMVTHDNSLAPRFSRHLVIQDGEIVPDAAQTPGLHLSSALLRDPQHGSTAESKSNGIHRDGTLSDHEPGVLPSGNISQPGRSMGKQ